MSRNFEPEAKATLAPRIVSWLALCVLGCGSKPMASGGQSSADASNPVTPKQNQALVDGSVPAEALDSRSENGPPRGGARAPEADAWSRQPETTAASSAGTDSQMEQAPSFMTFDPARFREPPADHAPGIQWLWPGGAVEDAELERQVALFAEVGYRMIALQTWRSGISPAQVEADPHILTSGTPAYFAHIKTVARAARAHGMDYDLTLGSGWPNGGVGVPSDAQEQQMFWQTTRVSGPGVVELPVPAPREPASVEAFNLEFGGVPVVGAFDMMAQLEAVVAAPVSGDGGQPTTIGDVVDLTDLLLDGKLRWDAPQGAHQVFWLFRNTTSHIMIGSTFPGPATGPRVIDHLGSRGAAWLVQQQIDPWLDALGMDKPKNLFIDSFELIGELPWSPGMAQAYSSLTGHAPYVDMPFFFRENSEAKYLEIQRESSPPAFAAQDQLHAQRVREDYERVRAKAFRTEYLEPVAKAIRERGVGLRLQAHGGWGNVLEDYATADVPESEGIFGGGSFDFVNLAGSAAHVAGIRSVSTETFTTLNVTTSPDVFDENSLWALVGLAFTAGVNRPVHSWCTYPYISPDGSRWLPNDPNPETPGGYTTDIRPGTPSWSFLPDFNRAQARVGYALSRGTPHVDVAWLMTAREYRDKPQLAVGNIGAIAPESEASRLLRAASYSYDRVSPSALATAQANGGTLHVGASSYRALLINEASAVDPELLEQVAQLAAAKIPIVWVGSAPMRASGAFDSEARDRKVKAAWQELSPAIEVVSAPADVPGALRTLNVSPEVEAPSLVGNIGILQRQTTNGRVVWLFNESSLAQTVEVVLRMPVQSAEWFDPQTGDSQRLTLRAVNGDGQRVSVMMAGLRGGILRLL